ncbi:putative nucleotide-diphospho-sugar transferase [Halomonas rhizosphaerae]|uniref:Nucleotide-diphospho-sugar transferase n=1 Tax=Halomonas rhizosphaerae TaxID=3043296 RepID=A0ABT6V0Y4_9GAMM|nr:putative nucleotide-diphospho-sugar transferase [Halomonas rhizosphaerae]MDI5891880.1 putative nucleotide-diphospho-sugar transferase [Halomonas rhizosphaerae]
MSKTLGVIYLALGRPYLAMALLSAKSVVDSNPYIPFTIVTNVKTEPSQVEFFRHDHDSWIYVDADVNDNRNLKTNILSYSEYEKTIFLDCDTVVMGDLSMANIILEYFDICLRLNRYPQKRKGKGDVRVLGNHRVGDFPHWNSGVMLIRNTDQAIQFFKSWNANYFQLGNKYDQVALVPTIFETGARVLSLEERWNATDPGVGRGKWRKDTIVYHYATNICDHLFNKILECDRLIDSDEGFANETRCFLQKKRRLKKSKMNLLKFFSINVMWRFSSPVKL